VKSLAKDFENKPKRNSSNKTASSADMGNQPGHSAEYHKAMDEAQKTKK
jgi:hypothetical protein